MKWNIGEFYVTVPFSVYVPVLGGRWEMTKIFSCALFLTSWFYIV
jgi:hypothetical protein